MKYLIPFDYNNKKKKYWVMYMRGNKDKHLIIYHKYIKKSIRKSGKYTQKKQKSVFSFYLFSPQLWKKSIYW